VRSAFWTSSIMGAVVAVVLGILMLIFAPNILQLFMGSKESPELIEETMRIGTLMIRTQCVTLFPHVWVMVINGLYQALGRPKESTFLGLSRQVIFLIPSVLILSQAFGVNGLACSQATADVLSMLVAIPMVLKQMSIIKGLNDGDEPPKGYGMSRNMSAKPAED